MTIDLARTATAGLRLIRAVAFGTGLVVASLAAAPTSPAGVRPVQLGQAASYAVLAQGQVVGTGEPVVEGDLGVFPGATLTGFPPGTVSGATRLGDAAAQRAQADLTSAYENAVRRTAMAPVGPELAGRTLAPGVYRAPASVTLDGTLTLDARGDPGAVFVFQLGSTFTTAENSRVEVINSPRQACNVFWAVGNSTTLGPGSQFVGHLMAVNSITVSFAATIAGGGALSRGGDVRLDSAAVRRTGCAAPGGSASPGGPTAPGGSASPGGPAAPGGSVSPGPSRSPGATPSRLPKGSRPPATPARQPTHSGGS